MLVVRGTKKLRDRVKGPGAADGEVSTTRLGDWFATAVFWRPQVALLVSERTLLPVLLPLAPAATLLGRVPAAIASTLRLHGADEQWIDDELAQMTDVRLAKTNSRSILGVMNELVFLADAARGRTEDLDQLALWLASVPLGPLHHRHGRPDRELAALTGAAPAPALRLVPPRPEPAAVYQLKITLRDIRPPIWRRVLVPADISLDALSAVIQAAFGWEGYHLHEFEFGRTRYGRLDPDDDRDPPKDERRARLSAVAKPSASFRYLYDFGDGWEHQVVVEKELRDVDRDIPACVDGRRACPPEDCGGPWGYAELLRILADPTDPEHQDRLEWMGAPFDPEAFDPDEFDDNLRLAQVAAQEDEDFL